MRGVVIIGAGTAGLSCAISALENGVKRVVVLDKKHEIGSPVRSTGGIADIFLREAGIDPDPEWAYPLTAAVVSAPGAEHVFHLNGQTIGYVMDQRRFEQHLARRAQSLGADIILGERVTPSYIDELRKDYDFVIAADGPFSVVRRHYLGIPDPDEWDVHKGFEFWVQGSVKVNLPPNAIHVHFNQRIAPYGYVWLFRYKDIIKYGLGVPVAFKSIDLSEVAFNNIPTFFDGEVKIAGGMGGVIPTPPPLARVVYDSIALVGEAGLQINSATGGGIQVALLAGRLCGEACARGSLQHYQLWYERELLPLLRRWYKIKRFLYKLDDNGFARVIRAFRGFTMRSVDPRRELMRAVRHVALRDPVLLVKLAAAWWT